MSSTFSSRIAPLLAAAGLGLAAPAVGAQGAQGAHGASAARAQATAPAALAATTPAGSAPIATTPTVTSRWVDGAPQAVEAKAFPGPVKVITTSRDGRLAAWSTGNGGRAVLAELRADGTLGAEHRLPTSATTPVFDARGRGLTLAGGWYARKVTWAPVAADGVMGRARTVRGAGKSYLSAFDVDADGNAVIAWFEPAGPRILVRAAVRRAGGSFGRAFTLPGASSAEADIGGLTVAVGAGGRALVAYVDGGTRNVREVRSWVGTVRRGFGALRTFGRPDGRFALASTVTSKGRAIVVWGSQRGGEEPGSPWVVQGASLGSGAARWTGVQTFDAGDVTSEPSRYIDLTDGLHGTTVLSWDGVTRTGLVPNVASLDAVGNLAKRQVLAKEGQVNGVAIDPSGNAIVAWQTGSDRDEVPTGAFMAVRSGGATRFGAPEPITAPAAPFFLAGARPAFVRIAAPAGQADPARTLVIGQRGG